MSFISFATGKLEGGSLFFVYLCGMCVCVCEIVLACVYVNYSVCVCVCVCVSVCARERVRACPGRRGFFGMSWQVKV